ncbi:MAG: hypothetical protein L0Z73_11605 [Gammaproteobacteria bacterium]|nr:hypothetical protein [Gammaproteobacteria bacterium]
MKSARYLIIILAFFTAPVSAENINDFDITCVIFTEAKNTTFKNHEALSAYIEENITARVQSKAVKDTYYVIFNLPPEERYDVFKKSAEHELKREWDCPAAKALLR